VKNAVLDSELVNLAARFRKEAGKSRAQAAREMGVSQTSIFHAEESPKESLARLRIRLIEAYSPYRVTGPLYLLRRK
jgi:DNA-binding XRE family transcriptional regulator